MERDEQRQRPGAIDKVGPASTSSAACRIPSWAPEDFSYVLQQIPGAMVFLAARRLIATWPPRRRTINHVVFDEDAMVTGTAMYAAMALNHLGS